MLTVLPIAESDFVGLVPLGNLNPTGHTFPTDHHYFYLPNPDHDDTTEVVPFVSPGTGHITEVAASKHLSAVPVFTDYKVTLRLCSGRRVEFGHVSSLSDAMVAQLGSPSGCDTYSTGGSMFEHCRYNVNVPVNAGDSLGTAGGNPGMYGFDMGVYDETVPAHTFAAQSRIESQAPSLLHAVSLLDVYEEPMRSMIADRMSNHNGTIPRTVEPRGGTVEQDVPGTAQGIWFRDGVANVYPEDPHLALVHDNVTPTLAAFSIGTSLPSATGAWMFTPEHAGTLRREFSEITPSATVYCYDGLTLSGALLLRLDAAGVLFLEHQSGVTCASGPTMTGAAVKFVR